jgi:hypothetical protein
MIFKNIYDYYIIFLIIIKILYYILYVCHFILTVLLKTNTNIFIFIEKLLKYFDIIFNFSMAILLLYLLNPYKKIEIDNAARGLLFLYAIILLLENFKYYINEESIANIIKQIFSKFFPNYYLQNKYLSS